jgi:hypothetical protein
MDTNYLKYGKKYPFLIEQKAFPSNGRGLNQSCGSCSKSHLSMSHASSNELQQLGFLIPNESSKVLILNSSSYAAGSIFVIPKMGTLQYRVVAVDRGKIVQELGLTYKFDKDSISIQFRLSNGFSSSLSINLAVMSPIIFDTPPVDDPSVGGRWERRWENCMRSRVPDGPINGINWVLTGGSIMDTGDCIGIASGWW